MDKYNWKYCSLGGETRVSITCGEDIAHLGELDQKQWTALSCPATGLNLDSKTLGYLDADADGRIKATEVIAAAEWLTSAITDKDSLLGGSSELDPGIFDTNVPLGKRLKASATTVLSNLGKSGDTLSIEDTADSVAIFKGSSLNGDGVVTSCATDDPALKTLIGEITATMGGVMDKSGVEGVSAATIASFYDKCASYSAWRKAAEDKSIFPLGDGTEDALATINAVRDKVADYFVRCKIVAFNPASAPDIDVSPSRIASISDRDLSKCAELISQYPLAHPSPDAALDLDAINPAWRDQFDSLREKTAPLLRSSIVTEAQWTALIDQFKPYEGWKASAAGLEVGALGLERVNNILSEDRKADLQSLIEADLAVKEEVESVRDLVKFQYLYRDFYKFLRNYVTFSDLYAPGERAIFEAGELYIDQRCCSLCIKVRDMSKHADMAMLSGMFLIYCSCTSKAKGETMDIMAVLTEGDTVNLRPGKNGLFYDLSGDVWDATITKTVDNPISIRQAFWSPYIKFWAFAKNLIDKSVADKESKTIADMQSKINAVASSVPSSADSAQQTSASKDKSPFDIAKFCGIFAAIGMAVGYIGTFVTKLVAGVLGTPLYKLVLAIAVIMLIISAPSCFIAWTKLRKRDLGPVLNAGGWAINSVVLINILFGGTLTSVVKYPVLMRPEDPFVMKKTPAWKKVLSLIILLSIIAAAILLFSGKFGISSWPWTLPEA